MTEGLQRWISARRQPILDFLAAVVNMDRPSEEKAAVDAVGPRSPGGIP